MSHVREKFNAKARQSTAGSRKRGKPKKTKTEGELSAVVTVDSNADIFIPKTKEEKEQDRKEKLRQEVRLTLARNS